MAISDMLFMQADMGPEVAQWVLNDLEYRTPIVTGDHMFESSFLREPYSNSLRGPDTIPRHLVGSKQSP